MALHIEQRRIIVRKEKISYSFYVAGVQFHELKKCINEIHEGDELQIAIETDERVLKHDSNAVKIIFDGEESVYMVGFVPMKRDLSVKVTVLLELGKAKCTVLEVTPTAKTWEQLKVRIEEV